MDAESEVLARLTLETLARKPRDPSLVSGSVATAAETAMADLKVPLYALLKEGEGYGLMECRGLKTIGPARKRPTNRESVDYLAWCKDDRAHAAILRALRARLTLILSAVADLEWLQRVHPEAAATLPKLTGQRFARALDAFGADDCEARSSRDVWMFVRDWPRNATATRVDPIQNWQDAEVM